jgi:hypothetical protein
MWDWQGSLDGNSLDWTLPIQRRNTSRSFFDLLRRGNLVEIHFRFISSTFPLNFEFPSVLPN